MSDTLARRSLALCLVLVLWYPLLRITTAASIDYNEGWNAYRQSMAFAGQPLYAAPPALWITNYPFLSFHLVGWAGALTGDVVLAGRILSLAAAVAFATSAGLTVRTFSGPRAGLLAGLILLLWLATFTPERRAMNDPELLGAAVAAFALFAALRPSAGHTWLVASAVAFALALFIKQDLVSLPLAVGLDLLLTRRYRLLTLWAATGLATAALLLALTDAFDGPFFFAHLLRSRAYLPGNLARNAARYALHFGLPLAVCLLETPRLPPATRRPVLILLLSTTLTSIVLSGGDGVAPNIFYPALLALAVAAGVTIAAPRAPRRAAATLIVAILAGAAFVPSTLTADLAARRDLPAADLAARRTIALLRATPGPAMCEDILLCYRAGKPLGPDPFFVHDQLATGRLPPSEIAALLAGRRTTAIEIDGALDPARPAAPRRRFDALFMQALLAHDRVASADGRYTILVPRDRPPPPPT